MIEYKVIDTRAKGVPLGDGSDYSDQLRVGLNELGADGWSLRTIVGGHLMIFSREVNPYPQDERGSIPRAATSPSETVTLKELYRLHVLEHRLWGRGKDGPNYDKSIWNELDRLIGRVGSVIAGEGWVAKALKEMDTTVDQEGISAFVPVETEDGRFTVRVVKYGEALPVIACGAMSFSDAEAAALKQNEAAGISPEVWWMVAERLKNTDV